MVIAAGVGQKTIKVISLRKRFRGLQMALVSLPQSASRGLASTGWHGVLQSQAGRS